MSGRRARLELEEELRQADDDFARGDYIELTGEQLARCIEIGESPWTGELDESLATRRA
jgi:hypothetical protein